MAAATRKSRTNRALTTRGVAELSAEMTGRPVRVSTIRAYAVRDKMPEPDENGLYEEQAIRKWIETRMLAAEEATVAEHQQKIRDALEQGEPALTEAIRAARAARLSWTHIADVGLPSTRRETMSRQGVWAHWKHVDEPTSRGRYGHRQEPNGSSSAKNKPARPGKGS